MVGIQQWRMRDYEAWRTQVYNGAIFNGAVNQ